MGTDGDEEAIRRTLAGYCQTCDDGRFDEFAELFTVTATLRVASLDAVAGREAIRAFMERAQPPERRGKHLCGEPLIEVDGGAATVATDFVFVGRVDGPGWAVTAAGRYDDRFERGPDGVWRLAVRTITLLES